LWKFKREIREREFRKNRQKSGIESEEGGENKPRCGKDDGNRKKGDWSMKAGTATHASFEAQRTLSRKEGIYGWGGLKVRGKSIGRLSVAFSRRSEEGAKEVRVTGFLSAKQISLLKKKRYKACGKGRGSSDNTEVQTPEGTQE